MGSLRNKLILSVIFGLVVMAALVFVGDFDRMGESLETFRWSLLPVVVLLTVYNYSLRFVKWRFYLHQIGAGSVSIGDSMIIFFSGMAMVMTPGKVGELLKPYFLKQVSGIPMSVSAPVVIAERLTDALAMMILASVGLVMYAYGWQALLVIFVLVAAFIVVLQYRPAANGVLALGERVPLVRRRVHNLRLLYESAYLLFKPRNLLIAVSISLCSWGGECIAFYYVLVGLGFTGTWVLLVQAAFVLGASSLIGGISMLPGGLGALDGSITGLVLLVVQGATRNLAVASTLIIRVSTLWFGFTIGILTLAIFHRRFSVPRAELPAERSA